MTSKLKKCPKCEKYTLFDSCDKCNEKTVSAHYKFIQLRDAPKGKSRKK